MNNEYLRSIWRKDIHKAVNESFGYMMKISFLGFVVLLSINVFIGLAANEENRELREQVILQLDKREEETVNFELQVREMKQELENMRMRVEKLEEQMEVIKGGDEYSKQIFDKCREYASANVSDEELKAIIAETMEESAKYEWVDYRMILAQIAVESSFDKLAVGRDKDSGLLQVIPSTWKWVTEVSEVGKNLNAYNSRDNLKVALWYLDFQYRQVEMTKIYYPSHVKERIALTMYNAGPKALSHYVGHNEYINGYGNKVYEVYNELIS